MRKKKYRYTEEELRIHDEAVKLRKMTDKQLVELFHEGETGKAAGLPPCSPGELPESQTKIDTGGVARLLELLAEGSCKGIKQATVDKLTAFARQEGLIA